jgi:chromosomal replication initiator protein
VRTDPNTLTKITAFVCLIHKVTLEDVKSPTRERPVAKARHDAIFLCRQLTDFTLCEIGAFFNRDHSTVISSVRLVASDVARSFELLDQAFRRLGLRVRQEVGSG